MKKVKISKILTLIFILGLSAIFLYLGMNFKSEKTLSYSETGNVDYKVYLKSNSDYNAPYLERGRKYIASLIDHIDVDYSYKFKGDQKMNYTCKYYILASAMVKDNSEEEKLIYEKKSYLLENQTKEFLDCEEFNLNESIHLDYEYYNKIIEEFNSKYNLTGNKNILKLTLVVSMYGSSKAFPTPIEDKSDIELNVPLTDKTVAVDLDYKEIDQHGEKVEVSKNKLLNITFVVIGIGLLAGALVIIIALLKEYKKFKQNQSYYEKTKNSILRDYSKVISKVDQVKNIQDCLEVESFDDLLNVRDCLEKPILFVEQSKDEISWFIVMDENVAYRYILKNQDHP